MKKRLGMLMAVVMVFALACPALAAVPEADETLRVEWDTVSFVAVP